MKILQYKACCILIVFAVSSCSLWQKSGELPVGEPDPMPVRDTLPVELQSLRDDGLALRGDRVIVENELDFPPRLKGQATTSTVRPVITPGLLPSMQESRQSMRAISVANARVKAALGERFVLLRSGWLDPDKDQGPDAISNDYRLTFYNYAKNEVVTVITTRQQEVIDLQSAPASVQPAESREEVDAAIEFVRRDDRYGRMIRELRGRGILTESPDKDRYLYLLFYHAPRTPAVFEATVNMSAGKVVSARPLR